MKPAQRLGLVALAVVVLVAAFVLLQPSDDGDDRAGAPVTATPAALDTTSATTPSTTEAPAQAAPAAARPPLLTAAGVRQLRVEHGGTVRFRVRSGTAEEVHVHGYDLVREVPAGRTVSMQFRARLEGVFEIEFEHSGIQIASLRVDP